MRSWAARHYGTPGGVASPSLQQAYTILATAAYNSAIDTASLESYPSVGDGMSHNTNATGILAAHRLFVQAALGGEVNASAGTFSYDLTDISRQVLVNVFSDAHAMLGARFGTPNDTNVLDSTAALVGLCAGIITDLDALLAADANFLLGRWIGDAAAWGGADAAWTRLLIFNARSVYHRFLDHCPRHRPHTHPSPNPGVNRNPHAPTVPLTPRRPGHSLGPARGD